MLSSWPLTSFNEKATSTECIVCCSEYNQPHDQLVPDPRDLARKLPIAGQSPTSEDGTCDSHGGSSPPKTALTRGTEIRKAGQRAFLKRCKDNINRYVQMNSSRTKEWENTRSQHISEMVGARS